MNAQPVWVKSSHSSTNGECVEAAQLGDGLVAVRDSKNPLGPRLTFEATAWRAFLAEVGGGSDGA